MSSYKKKATKGSIPGLSIKIKSLIRKLVAGQNIVDNSGYPLLYNNDLLLFILYVFQWEFLRGPLAKWQTTRAGCGVQGQMVLSGRVDTGIQGDQVYLLIY